jgi:hypothetical protein
MPKIEQYGLNYNKMRHLTEIKCRSDFPDPGL